jgi:phosphohistidine swiveling domain-containing protein
MAVQRLFISGNLMAQMLAVNSTTYSSTTFANGDIITCVLTSNAICPTGNPATSNSVVMVVNPNLPVSVSISSDNNNICAGTNVTFTAVPTNGGAAPVYQWKEMVLNVGANATTYSNTDTCKWRYHYLCFDIQCGLSYWKSCYKQSSGDGGESEFTSFGFYFCGQ